MKKRFTLKQALKNAPEKKVIELLKAPLDYKSATREELVKWAKNGTCLSLTQCFIKYPDGFFFTEEERRLKRCGNKIFPRTIKNFSLSVRGRKMYIDGAQLDVESLLRKFFGYSWLVTDRRNPDGTYKFDAESDTVFNILSRNKVLLRSAICGNIYSMETFWKAYARNLLNVSNVDWKVFRNIILQGRADILYDVRDFDSSDFNSALRSILSMDNGHFSIYKDALGEAVILDTKICAKWSLKRLQEEHLKNTRLVMRQEIDTKKVEPIFENPVEGDGIHCLNTEKEVFEEGMDMHHCVYTCYFDRINKCNYIAYHMSFPENCTFGIVCRDGKPVLDQAHTYRNGLISNGCRDRIGEFLDKYQAELVAMFIQGNNRENGFVEDENLPF